MVMLLMFFGVLALMLMGVSTAVTMGFVSLSTFWMVGGATADNLFLLPQRMYAQVSGITLMSIPFFLLMGNLMNVGGVSSSIFGFGRACLGHRWGGLSNAAIVSCMIMAAMSGSAAACAAGIGMIAIAEMEKAGYGKTFACGTIASAGTLGPIIPPSITMILYASMTQNSVNQLFAAGALPGIAIGAGFMIYSSFISKKRGYAKVDPMPWRDRLRACRKAFLSLMTPVIVIGGMFGGLFTATEAAAVAALYVMILGLFVYRSLKLKDLPRIFWETVEQTAKIMFVIATASFFQYVLLYTRIPQQTISLITAFCTSIVPILLIVIVLVLIMGCFLEGTAILLIMVPIFVPLAQAYEYSEIQLAVVICIALAVGCITPPVGLNLYVVSSITGEKLIRIARESVPYLVIMIVVCLLAAFVAPFSLTLPKLLS